MKNLIKYSFYPLFLVIGFLTLLGLQSWLGNRLSLTNITTVAVFIMIAITYLFERLQPYRDEWNQQQNDFKSDFILTILVFPLVINACRFLVQIYPAHMKINIGMELPFWIQVIIGVLIAEFLFYWVHRLSHENKLLWQLHVRHHAVKRVYWMNSGTLNPMDMILNFTAYCLPFAVLNLHGDTLEYALYFTAITGLLEHANVSFRAGPLNFIFNTAELHRWHHSVVVAESQRNYGKALSIWDLTFGTFFKPANLDVKDVGVDPQH